MVVDLVDYVPSLKREVQPPGADLFADVLESAWVGYLGDAFWEARLDGFLEGYEVIENGPGDMFVQPRSPAAPDLPREAAALLVLYAGVRILRNRILNTNTSFRAKAGPVEFEQQNSATMLAEMLKQLKATKDRVIDSIDSGDETGVMILDAYSTRLFEPTSYYGNVQLSG